MKKSIQTLLPYRTQNLRIKQFPMGYFFTLLLLFVISGGLWAQLAEEMTIRYDLRRTVNQRYQGLAYGETRLFIMADPWGKTGAIFQYRLDELSRDGRLEARLVRNREWTEFEYRPNATHFGTAFATPHSSQFGSLYVPPQDDVLIFQNFPVRPPEPLREGLVWQAPAAFLTDPRGEGEMTRIPVLVEYRVSGLGEYGGQPAWIVSALYALRYRGDDQYGDRTITGALGSHQVIIYYSDAPRVEDQRPLFFRITAQEQYSLAGGGSIEQRGFYLVFLTHPLPYGNEEVIRIASDPPQPQTQAQPQTPDTSIQSEPSTTQPSPAQTSDDQQIDSINRSLAESQTRDIQVNRVPEGFALEIQNLLFLADQAILLPGERNRLDSIARVLKEFPDKQFLVTGHTAAIGSVESQISLSIERAQTIVTELINRGIDSRRLMFEGKGGSVPIGNNSTEEGRQKNRRVEITIISPRADF